MEEKEPKVTMKQEIFCQAWVDSIGNGTRAALEAFDIEGKELLSFSRTVDRIKDKEAWEADQKERERIIDVASSMASEYLRKPDIRKRIDEILDERGFNDEVVKQEHFKLIRGAEDTVKMRAIADYYKLKGSYAPDRHDHTSKGEQIGVLLTAEQRQRLAEEELKK